QDVLHQMLEGDVGDPDEDAEDHARDQHHHGALDNVALARPFDLAKLAPGLDEEPAEAGDEPAPAFLAHAATALGARRRLGSNAHGRLGAAAARPGQCRLALLLAPRTTPRSRL